MAKVKARKRKSKKAKKAKTKATKKVSKVKAEKKMDRLEASVIVLKGIQAERAYHSAVNAADELYAKNGGVENPKEASYAFKRASKVMCLLGLISVADGMITRLEG